jgi:N-acyl homoserine lactone hydrolase
MADNTNVKRLYLMRVAHGISNSNPYVCYLVQTTDGRNVLIDTGLPRMQPGENPDLEDEGGVVEQLAKIGLKPGDINLLVTTHFDMDHAGRLDEFPGVPFVTQQAHYDWALTHPRPQRARAKWDVEIDRFHFIKGDHELLPGLKLIETSGHNPGHQSVLVTLPKTGKVLLAIDAISRSEFNTRERVGAPMDVDGAGAVASTRKMLDLAEKEHVAFIVMGHDADQWNQLRKLPEYYE